MSDEVGNKIFFYWVYSISFLYYILVYDACYFNFIISKDLYFRIFMGDIGVYFMYINLGLAIFLFINLKSIESILIKSFLVIILICICFENLFLVFLQIISPGPSLY